MVQIPATWDQDMAIRARLWSSIFPGQRHRPVHRRPKKSSRIWAQGYKIGYTNSVLASSGLCDLKMQKVGHSNYELKVDRRDFLERDLAEVRT